MLVCPHCQFENPNAHKFCQNCGSSLTEVSCLACGTLVPFDMEYCPQCGNTTGKIWRAIVSLAQPIAEGANLEEGTLPLPATVNTAPTALPDLDQGKFLDSQQRYQVLEPFAASQGSPEVETRVLDCQPFQPSLVEVFLHPELDNLTPIDLEQTVERVVPEHARLYWDLQDRYPSLSLPKIHDAWEQDKVRVILLEDRTHFPLLLDCCQKEDVLPLQVLHWLCEMVEYWTVLEPEHCCQSLLKLDNLRVDPEDYVLCLGRLYADSSDRTPSLTDLGNLWLTLFEQSNRTQHAELFLLCRDLLAGTITTIEQLQSRIDAIATLLQPIPGQALSASPAILSAPFPTRLPAVNQIDEDQTADLAMAASTMIAPLDSDEDLLGNEGDDLPTVVLPMRLFQIEDAGRTDVGRQRNHNEDCFYVQTEIRKIDGMQGRSLHAKGLYILCDGMGGHASGEVASNLAVETLQQYFQTHWADKLPDEQTIRDAILFTNRVIYDRNQENDSFGSGRMGTTLLLLLLQDTKAAIAHVGDSRLYRFSRRQGLEQVTTDHEVGQREIQRGVEPTIAYARPDAYQLTQALGPRDENFVNPDVKFLEFNEDMLLLLCSDGLTDNDFLELNQQNMVAPLLDSQTNLEQGITQLIEAANQYNGHDNITTIAIRVKVRPNLAQLNLP